MKNLELTKLIHEIIRRKAWLIKGIEYHLISFYFIGYDNYGDIYILIYF